MMNQEVKAKWLEALRSGKYKQTKGVLFEPAGGGYCCLGVLCELQGGKPNLEEGGRPNMLLPDGMGWKSFVWKVAGLREDEHDTLANMNDNGASFAEIADYIEANF